MQISQPLMKPPFLCHSSEDVLLNIYKNLNLYHTSVCLFNYITNPQSCVTHPNGIPISTRGCLLISSYLALLLSSAFLSGMVTSPFIVLLHCLGLMILLSYIVKFPKTDSVVVNLTGVTSWRIGSCDCADDLVSFTWTELQCLCFSCMQGQPDV